MSFRSLIIAACAILPGEDAGFRAIAYVVRWHGSRVLVVRL